MSRIIDCFIVGFNEMKFSRHEKFIRSFGENSGAYRELSYDFINYEHRPCTATDIINILSEDSDDENKFCIGNVFSGTIAYLGTYLYRRGLTFDYVNSFQDEKEYLAMKLQEGNIRTIAITTTFYTSPVPIIEIIAFIKKYNNTAKIILGGPFVASQIRTHDGESILKLFKSINADFYVNSSQGEAALVNIIKALKEKSSYDNINNIIYRYEGSFAANKTNPEDNRLEENMVDWGLFSDRMKNSIAVRTSISCPFSCSYCEFPQQSGKYQPVSVEAIKRELDSIEKTGKVEYIGFIDDTFNVPPERFKDILRMMIKNKYRFKWNSFFRCQFADREMLELMKESGCDSVYLGIESGNPQILKNMNKVATVEKYKTGISLLNEFDIYNMASIIVGFPGETEETVKDTLNFIEENSPTFYKVHLWYCSTITPIWKQREKFGIKGAQYQWSHNTMDWSGACDIIHEMFLNIKNSVSVPHYGFEFWGVLNLLHRGLKIDHVKEFLRAFNDGVKENKGISNNELGSDVIQRIKAALESTVEVKDAFLEGVLKGEERCRHKVG